MKHNTRSMTRGPLQVIDRLRDDLAKAEAERDALRERCEKLEWLVEVQEARKSRVWLMIIWQRVEREKTMSLEQQRVGHSWAHNCLDELYKAALDATEEK